MKIFKTAKQYIEDNLQEEAEYRLIWLPFWFALGIAFYFALPSEPNLWLVLLIVELWILLMILLRNSNLRGIMTVVLIIMCGFLNIYAHTLYTSKKVQFLPQKMTYISGFIDDISYNDNNRQRLLLVHAQDYDSPLRGKFRITVTNPHEHFSVGQCVELVATIFPPTRVPVMNGFQLNRKYFYEQISAVGFSNSEIFPIKCVNYRQGFAFRAYLNAVRQNISNDIAQILPPNTAGVAGALLIGEKSRILPQITDNYRGSGLAHFLSVSGLHLGAIAGLVFFLVRWLLALFPAIALRIDSKKPAAVVAILFSAAYLLISGMAVPAERAFIMTTVVLIGVIFNRQAISMRMVSVAALVILLLQPQSLISISFQMSFAAVYALIAFYEKYAGKIYRLAHRGGHINKIFWYLMGIVIGDFVASLATMPFALYHFHQVAIYTSLGNLLAGPIIGLWLMPNVLLCLAALPFGLLKYPLLVLGQGLDILNMITTKVSALPDSLISVSTLSFGGFICIIIGGFWLCVWSKKWRLWGILPIMCGVLSMFFAEHPQMIAAPNGTAFALKNNDGKMQILSPKKDRWLRKIWSENFQLDEDYDKSCLKQEFCAYQNVKFNKNGEVWLNNKKLDMCAGGYFYGEENMRFVPLWNCSERRVWTINNAQ